MRRNTETISRSLVIQIILSLHHSHGTPNCSYHTNAGFAGWIIIDRTIRNLGPSSSATCCPMRSSYVCNGRKWKRTLIVICVFLFSFLFYGSWLQNCRWKVLFVIITVNRLKIKWETTFPENACMYLEDKKQIQLAHNELHKDQIRHVLEKVIERKFKMTKRIKDCNSHSIDGGISAQTIPIHMFVVTAHASLRSKTYINHGVVDGGIPFTSKNPNQLWQMWVRKTRQDAWDLLQSRARRRCTTSFNTFALRFPREIPIRVKTYLTERLPE